MLRKNLFFLIFVFSFKLTHSQDTSYAREIIKSLTSKSCFGRGYVKNGLHKAEKYILQEIKKQNVLPLFKNAYTQSFKHSVNTFPKNCDVTVNDRLLVPGVDYIINPGSKGLNGEFKIQKIDSVRYADRLVDGRINLMIKKKLTYSVSHVVKPICEIELATKVFNEPIHFVRINLKNKFIQNFKSKNIGCYILGESNSDSCIVFSAHYDHLGGMGQQTFFPGANDNASGVSVLLNMIKYYALNKPKYKTVFLFFAGEEAGLLGSKYFVESNSINLKSINFLINLDLLGTGDDGIMVVNGAIHEREFSKLNQINNEQQLVKQIKKRGKAANSDHYWFSEAGVPCFFIYTMGGISAYHDVFDIEKTLPLTDYVDVFKLITEFVNTF